MSTVRIPAKKTMEPGMSILDINNIWDYIDMYAEEEAPKVPESSFDDKYEFVDDSYDYDDSWEDFDGPYRGDNDWESDYRDAFEDDPEAVWGREW